MTSREKPCRHCQKLFLAEPDENFEYASVCFACEVEMQRLISSILTQKFGPPKKAKWFDEYMNEDLVK